MKTSILKLGAIACVCATASHADTMYRAEVDVMLSAQPISSFVIADTMYGVPLSNCRAQVQLWVESVGSRYMIGDDASFNIQCVEVQEQFLQSLSDAGA